mgnify:CR=1 FL=1|tara:strand:+ start:3481 stop:3738 length:258 start_codon:yes stop_codon:yes gene_type:complete
MENQEKKPQNPNAFPHYERNIAGDMNLKESGMTLRDYFAAKAMQGVLSNSNVGVTIGKHFTKENESLAITCYSMADAMLKERENQ